ncbi:MAG TPA: DUF416 family protein [Thermoanaerobaculia bacterium]|jgi:uncharacterized protein YjaG (DUF416 family)|nr:DUF416 family protein [Thermoanaerobaculia bacterium]
MTKSFDPQHLHRTLERLPPFNRVAFAASCCERLLPNYAAFAAAAHWGHPSILRDALDFVWASLEKGHGDPEHVERLIKRCETVIPHTDDFSLKYTSAAVDAGTAVIETLQSVLDGVSQHVVDVATFCRDTVDMFIQERDGLKLSDPDFETKIAHDPLMLQELSRQADTLAELSGIPNMNQFFLKRLREECRAEGISNIGLSA